MMDPKDLSDLRSKRLNFFGKLVSQNPKSIDQVDEKTLEKQTNNVEQQAILTSNEKQVLSSCVQNKNLDDKNSKELEPLPNQASLADFDSQDLLNKLFSEKEICNRLNQPKVYRSNSIYSEDASTLNTPKISRINSKFEEFKKIVEDSYTKHVLNREDSLRELLSRQTSSNFSNDELVKPTPNSVPLPQNENLVNLLVDNVIATDSVGSSRFSESLNSAKSVQCKVQYMSAYNIYETVNEPDEISKANIINSIFSANEIKSNVISSNKTNKDEAEKLKFNSNNFTNKKFLSSNGSSLNTSPTSLSSDEFNSKRGELNLKLNLDSEQLELIKTPSITPHSTTTPRKVKPPETPNTNNLKYRKNRLNYVSKSLAVDKQNEETNFNKTEKAQCSNAQNNQTLNTNAKSDNKLDIFNLSLNNSPSLRSNLASINVKTTKEDVESKRVILDNKLTDSMDKVKDLIFNYNANGPLMNKFSKDNNKKSKIVLDEDDDDLKTGSDTLDMFSSQDSLNDLKIPNEFKRNEHVEARTSEYDKKFDLKIDLGQLSDDEEENEMNSNQNHEIDEDMIHKQFENNGAQTDSPPMEPFWSKREATFKQTKPDNIPNLALDIDDDKSVSVAASIAKSMCKEINYKNEMEMIYLQQEVEQQQQQQQQKAKQSPNPTTSVLKNHNNKEASKKKVNDESIKTSHFLRPPKSSSREPSSRPVTSYQPSNKKPLQLQQSFAANATSTESAKQNSLIKPQDSSDQTKEIKRYDSVTNSIDVFQTKYDHKSLNKKVDKSTTNLKSELKTKSDSQESLRDESPSKEKKEKKVRKPHWESASNLNPLQRSQSALERVKKNEHQNEKQASMIKNVTESVEKRPLFLTYSKLVTIESNIEKEKQSNQEQIFNRPPIAQINHSMPTTVDLKFDLPFAGREHGKAENSLKETNVNLKDLLNNLPIPSNESNSKEELNALTELEKKKEIFEADWQKLPHEIWLKILAYLSQPDLTRFGRTCKSFNNLYLDSSLWKTITIKYRYDVCDEWLNWIGMRMPNELNIVQCNGNISLHAISNMFRNIGEELTTLNLSRCSNGSLSGDNFALQASIRCPNVTNLDLSWTLLSNQTLKLIVDSFKKIEMLNLSGCSMIKEDGVNQLLIKHGEYLKKLEISGCLQLSSNCILNIGAYCRNVEYLNISNCHRMSNESIIEACPQWLKLKHLDLRGIKNIKNNCISALVRKCTHLDSLALGECLHISDAAIAEVTTYKSNLKYLDLSGCKKITDNTMRSIGSYFTKLEHLNLKGTSITDTGLITLANGRCSHAIVYLNLSFLPFSESVLMKLLRNLKGLRQIDLYGCYNIKNIEEVKKVEHNPNGKTLQINF